MHHANIAEKKRELHVGSIKWKGGGKRRGKKEGKENKTRREKILHVTSVFSGGRGREKEGGYVEIVGVRVRKGEIDI